MVRIRRTQQLQAALQSFNRFPCLFLAVLFLLIGKPLNPASAWQPGAWQPKQKAPQQLDRIRIRSTVASDLKPVASFLSTVVSNNKKPYWRAQLDQLWAQSDIEALLRNRLLAIQAGKQAWQETVVTKASNDNRRQRLIQAWADHQEWRNRVERAARETAEPNVWTHAQESQDYQFCLTPPDQAWLFHVQMTAVDANSRVIGFLEVALLSQPNKENKEVCFGPTILNLATHPDYRRRGIAKRLLQSATTLVRRHWQAPTSSLLSHAQSLGLYVHQANQAALALYESAGFEIVTTAADGDGETMWYMLKSLQTDRVKNSSTHRQQAVSQPAVQEQQQEEPYLVYPQEGELVLALNSSRF